MVIKRDTPNLRSVAKAALRGKLIVLSDILKKRKCAQKSMI